MRFCNLVRFLSICTQSVIESRVHCTCFKPDHNTLLLNFTFSLNWFSDIHLSRMLHAEWRLPTQFDNSSVVEFQRWWVLKSQIFGQESTYSKYFFFFNLSMNYGSSKSAKIALSKSIFNVKNQLIFFQKNLGIGQIFCPKD